MTEKQLAQLLVEKRVLDEGAATRAFGARPADQSFADWLVGQGTVQEVDLLRVMAQATEVRFISSARLADLRVTREALDKVPANFALQHQVLPITFDAANKTLTVAMAEPAKLAALDELPDVARMDAVVAVLALPSAIRAAAHRLYGLADRAKPAAGPPEPVGKCSNCGEPYVEEQLECAECGLLLNPEAPSVRTGPSIVRALLASPTGMRRLPERPASHDAPTRAGFVVQLTDASVPEIAGNVGILRSLAELEAFLLTWIDGELTLGELSLMSGLMAVEVRSVVASLVEREVLQLKPVESIEEEVVTLPTPILTPELLGVPPLAAAPIPPPVLVARAAVAPQAPVAPPPPVLEPREESRTAREARAARQEELLARFKRPEPRAEAPPPAPAPRIPLESQRAYDATLSKAMAMEKKGDVGGAIRLLKEGIARAPNPAPLYNRLAVLILNRQRDAKQAEELLHKAIALEPENPVYRQNLLKVLALL